MTAGGWAIKALGAGDAAFMAKAQARLRGLVGGARIVLLASHDTSALKAICSRGLVLRQGRLIFDGPIGAAVEVALAPEARP